MQAKVPSTVAEIAIFLQVIICRLESAIVGGSHVG